MRPFASSTTPSAGSRSTPNVAKRHNYPADIDNSFEIPSAGYDAAVVGASASSSVAEAQKRLRDEVLEFDSVLWQINEMEAKGTEKMKQSKPKNNKNTKDHDANASDKPLHPSSNNPEVQEVRELQLRQQQQDTVPGSNSNNNHDQSQPTAKPRSPFKEGVYRCFEAALAFIMKVYKYLCRQPWSTWVCVFMMLQITTFWMLVFLFKTEVSTEIGRAHYLAVSEAAKEARDIANATAHGKVEAFADGFESVLKRLDFVYTTRFNAVEDNIKHIDRKAGSAFNLAVEASSGVMKLDGSLGEVVRRVHRIEVREQRRKEEEEKQKRAEELKTRNSWMCRLSLSGC